jgi:hypothetical protein
MVAVAARHGSIDSGPNAAFGPENGSNTTTLSVPFDVLAPVTVGVVFVLEEPQPASTAAEIRAGRPTPANQRDPKRSPIFSSNLSVAVTVNGT